MVVELIAVAIGLVAGVAGIVGETRSKETGRLTPWAWVSLSVVITAALIGSFQAYRTWSDENERQEQAAADGYDALAGVYRPLSMWLDRTGDPTVGAEATTQFPPDFGVDRYEKLRNNPAAVKALVDRLTSIVASDGKPDYSALEGWGAYYRLALNGLDPVRAKAYGLPADVRAHLRDLSRHSLFVRGIGAKARSAVSDARCRGAIDDLIEEIADRDTPPMWRERCKAVLVHELTLAFENAPPSPPFAKTMREVHLKDCQKNQVRPFCNAIVNPSGEAASGSLRPPG